MVERLPCLTVDARTVLVVVDRTVTAEEGAEVGPILDHCLEYDVCHGVDGRVVAVAVQSLLAYNHS